MKDLQKQVKFTRYKGVTKGNVDRGSNNAYTGKERKFKVPVTTLDDFSCSSLHFKALILFLLGGLALDVGLGRGRVSTWPNSSHMSNPLSYAYSHLTYSMN